MGAKELIALFFTAAALKIAVVNIIGGTLFGFTIGFVPIYTSYVGTNSNCSLYTTDDACFAIKHANCDWNATTKLCYFTNYACDKLHVESTCEADNYHDDKCVWDKDATLCKNAIGWNAVQSGVFAGAMIVGGLLGSLVAGEIVRRLGRKKSFMIVGGGSLIASVLIHIAAAADSYGLLVFGRVVIGASCGLACVVCPMYVEEMAEDVLRKPIGVLFQVFCTLGIAFAAAMGLALSPSDFSVDVNMAARFQGFIAFSTVFSFAMLLVGVFAKESTKWRPQGGDIQDKDAEDIPLHGANDAVHAPEATWSSNTPRLLVALAMALAQQMTGINAIMNYAPNITKSMGFQPLTGNLLVMVWNFVTTLVSIPLASRFSMRQMFLTGTLIASLACLCTGIPVYPGVTTADAKHALAALGIAIFIAAFEIGMGPCFYVLCQELFPKAFRPKGSSFTMVVQFFFNIVINVFFPIAVQGLSGGPSGDQDTGMGVTFMFFGVIGTLSWFVLAKWLHPAEATEGYSAIGGAS